MFCETVELAVEANAWASAIGLPVAAELSADPLDAAAHRVRTGAPLALALTLQLPAPEAAVRALHVCSQPERLVVGAVVDPDGLHRGLFADLGFVCLLDVPPAVSALALLAGDAARAYRASGRKLSAPDRARLAPALQASDKSAGRLLSLGAEGIALEPAAKGTKSLRLGPAGCAAQALLALAAAAPIAEPALPFARPDALSVARDILFGPPRLLSDPASKTALAPFGLPMPQEELCASPSRAAVEAARLGFPVRISLASPDLRVWDYPDLSVDGVDNAARVRDVFRQLLLTAESRAPGARVLGVTVTATTLAKALLRISARPLPEGRVYLRAGFCDPHGATAKDQIATALPLGLPGFDRAFARLSGRELLSSGRGASDEGVGALAQLCVRLASFVDAFRGEVARVELHPIALLVGGGAEVREAAVQVTDAFVQELSR
ncbi:MAG TPA: acetate--CoA ligase family protein [Polyangiales bacterium]